MTIIAEFREVLVETLRDVAPIALILGVFQFAVLKRPIPNLARVLLGLAYVLLGLTLFLIGLRQALFPVGRLMAEQFTDPGFVGAVSGESFFSAGLNRQPRTS